MNAVGHIDANYFYGQIEALYRPDIRGKAFIVGGDQESRKGIVLTKSPLAKKMGVKTGTSVQEALGIYPKLIVIPANYPLYLHFSQRMREVVLEYTDTIKPFGSDELWAQIYGDRTEVMATIAKIRQALWRQLCLTVSIGVGDNLPYAKLGSDLASDDGVCELWNEDKERLVYPLPVGNLLYVGPATVAKLRQHGIITIGDLANTPPEVVCQILKNKGGTYLWQMACGQDGTKVAHLGDVDDVKSIGNSNTMPRDLVNDDDVRMAFYMLAESVAERMREAGFEATTLQISVRDNELLSFERQMKLPRPTNLTVEMVTAAMELFKQHYHWQKPIRSLGLRGSNLIPEGSVYQLSILDDEEERHKTVLLERCIDRIRGRFGHDSIKRATLLCERLKSVNANNDIGDEKTFYSY
ncbi:MAG: DNA polymerase IV [Lachnospiraceae bacterium]|jgi:DNA polymerase-4|nr:DNA polymerase IV [Lachnospiraceae bacterium]